MKKATRLFCCISLATSLFAAGTAFATDITGAGATFPYPIYAKWAEAYKAKTNTGLNYQSIGSGGGIKQILAKTVDFGATDAPMEPADQDKNGLTQFPTVVGGVVPVVNINGVSPGELKLSGDVLADIFLGKITNWNDPKIAAENQGVNLPDQDITVVHRSDGSGTTFIFTTYLSQVSPSWKSEVGADKAVSWKAGTGGKGNEGVASYVQRIKGSIGYVEYAYALQNKMTSVQLKNHDGNYVKPEASAFQAAAGNAHWDASKGFFEILTNEPGANSWPITGATFILVYKNQENPAAAKEVLNFFDWSYKNGNQMASDLDYVPLPQNVQDMIRTSWKQNVKANGKAVW